MSTCCCDTIKFVDKLAEDRTSRERCQSAARGSGHRTNIDWWALLAELVVGPFARLHRLRMHRVRLMSQALDPMETADDE